MQRVTLIIFLTLLTFNCSNKEKEISSLNEQELAIEKKIEQLLAQMTLQEKIGQMNQYNGFWDATGPSPREGEEADKYKHLKEGLVGSMLNVRGVDKVRAVQEIAVEKTRLGIPLIIGLDVIHGHKTLTPIPLGEAASWDLEAIQNSARNAAIEAFIQKALEDTDALLVAEASAI